MGGVKIIESQSRSGHFIENGSLEMGMTIVTGFLPTMVVAHEKNDVGLASSQRFGVAEEDGE